MIDLYTFLIIKPDLLNVLISKLGASLLIESEVYTATLIIANLCAFMVIYMIFNVAMYLYRILLPKEFRRF